MTVIASRSSTTANVIRNVRSAVGRWVDNTASTASANAMSVAVGTAQPTRFSEWSGRDVDRNVDRRGHHHAADCGQDRQRRAAGVAEVTGDELALEFHAHDEEKDREQAVGRPG